MITIHKIHKDWWVPGERLCGNCMHFDSDELEISRKELGHNATGECHRYPPKLIEDDKNGDLFGLWPPTFWHLWCGEFEAAEVELAA